MDDKKIQQILKYIDAQQENVSLSENTTAQVYKRLKQKQQRRMILKTAAAVMIIIIVLAGAFLHKSSKEESGLAKKEKELWREYYNPDCPDELVLYK